MRCPNCGWELSDGFCDMCGEEYVKEKKENLSETRMDIIDDDDDYEFEYEDINGLSSTT